MTKKFVVIIGALLLMFFIITAAFPELIAPYSAKDMDSPWLSSSSEHILGTNKLGYDVFSELIFATRKTLITGVLASTLSLIIATLLGYLCLEENIVGKVSITIIDTMTLLPRLVTMIVLSTFFNTNSFSLIVLNSFGSFISSSVYGKILQFILKTSPSIFVSFNTVKQCIELEFVSKVLYLITCFIIHL